MRGLQQRLTADELKLELLRAQVKAGLDACERGAFNEVDDADLSNVMPRGSGARGSGAPSNHGAAGVYWVARSSRAMTAERAVNQIDRNLI